MTDPTPLHIFEIDLVDALQLRPGDPTPIDGHEEHRVSVKTLDCVLAWWLTVRCSCGKTFSGAIDAARSTPSPVVPTR